MCMNFENNGFKLSKKLFEIAKLIEGDFVVDVGCDHGKLPIYLALEGKRKKIYACDVREKPLKIAKQNAKNNGVFEKIEFILSDGLKKIPYFVDCVVVAGLGGKTIGKIIFNESFLSNSNVKFILQPQSFLYLLRYNIYKNGFIVEKEVHIVEHRKCYDVLVVRFCGNFPIYFEENLKLEELNKKVILGEIASSSEYSYEFLKTAYLKELKILKGLEKAKNRDLNRIAIEKKIFKILKEEIEKVK